MKKKNEINYKRITIICVICFAIVIIGVSAYLIFGHSPRKDFRGGENFQPLNESTKDEITSFFESSPSSLEIEDYCKENQMYCMSYCREINPNDGLCKQIMNFTQLPKGNQPGEKPLQ